MPNVIAVTPLPNPIPNPTLGDLPLPQRLSLLGQPALIAEMCELHDRLSRIEYLLDLTPPASVPPTAAPTTSAPPTADDSHAARADNASYHHTQQITKGALK